MPKGSTTVFQQHTVPSKPQQTIAPSVIAVDPSKMDSGAPSSTLSAHKILDRKRLLDLVKEIDPMAQLEDDVEEVSQLLAC